uniref:Putative secreted peptide n=1 Tax=Anopheles braziliensis TaxID=58242 RepID=A0A2M3ZXQ6_9DIPT
MFITTAFLLSFISLGYLGGPRMTRITRCMKQTYRLWMKYYNRKWTSSWGLSGRNSNNNFDRRSLISVRFS